MYSYGIQLITRLIGDTVVPALRSKITSYLALTPNCEFIQSVELLIRLFKGGRPNPWHVSSESLLCYTECVVLRGQLPKQARKLNKPQHPSHQALVNLPKAADLYCSRQCNSNVFTYVTFPSGRYSLVESKKKSLTRVTIEDLHTI